MEIGARIGPFDTTIDAEFVRAYASATSSRNPSYLDGTAVPPLAIATRIFEAQLAGFEGLIPAQVRESARGGVHGEHDVVLLRALRPGEPLKTLVVAHSVRPMRSNVRLVLRHVTVDGSDQPVAEQLWTTILIGTTSEAAGPELPEHTFPDTARQSPAGARVVRIDDGTAHRYAEVSRDFSAHHFDVEAARRSGFDAVFLHGLCTLGLCTEAAVDTVAGGDPGRIRRVAVRFASPAFLGHDLSIQLYAATPDTYAFEADVAGSRVMANGWVELRQD